MSVDFLHNKIRKLKNPLIVDMSIQEKLLPSHLLDQEGNFAKAYPRFCSELLEALAGVEEALPSHEKGEVVLTLSAEISHEILKETVEKEGYKVL